MKFLFILLPVFAEILNETYGAVPESTALDSSLQLWDGSTNCTSSVTFCSADPKKCNSVFYCLPGKDDPIEYICPLGETCNAGRCSSYPSTMCEYASKSFLCQMTGIFPEPTSCQKYNLCCYSDGSPGQTLDCEGNYAYNPLTTFCDIKLPTGECNSTHRVVPPCTSLGQNGPLVSNPVLYYICLPYSPGEDEALYPYMYKCPNGKKFIENLFMCA